MKPLKRHYKLKLIWLFIVSFSFAYSQNKNIIINQIAENFNDLTENINLDNIYIQTSKNIYETEEDLWFKAYVLDAQYHMPSKRNKILYVQLINDETKQAVWVEKYEIENGFVDGHLYIQDSLKTGCYSLSAYSECSYFKNQEEFYALKKITIRKNIKEKTEVVFIKNDTITQFSMFPEGGYLVSNLENTLAFKAINEEGLPVKVSGTFFENDVPILDFKSLHAGIGSFNFTPKKSNIYHIQLSESDKKYQLPEIKDSGKVLRLASNTNDFLNFNISQSENLKPETIYLRLQTRGVIYSIASAKLKDEVFIKIPLKNIPQGIAEVTLFDSDLKPVAERLVYVKPNQKLNIKTVLNKSEYETREKATLKIKVTDKYGAPVEAHLGLSVFDKIYQNKSEPKNILTHYYLSTQLKGPVYNPSYYFDETNKNRLEALNLLLLTQGWRRYVWQEDNIKERGKQIKPQLSDSIIGKVRLERITKKYKTEGQQFVMVFASDSLKGKYFIMTDSLGIFRIDSKHFKMGEKGYVYIKPMTSEKPKYIINIKDTSFDIINLNRKTIPINYPLSKLKEELLEDNRATLVVSNKVNKLEEVVLSAKKKRIFRDKYLSVLDSLAKLDMNTDFVHGGWLNCPACTTGDKPVEGETYTIFTGTDVPTSHPFYFGYPTREFARIEYHYPKFTEEELLKKFNLKMIKGYYGKREFYKPIHDEVSINDPFPDYRNTLFWKPDIITNKNGEAIIEFHCSDINTYFTGNIEGVSGSGLLGSDNFEFKVIKQE